MTLSSKKSQHPKMQTIYPYENALWNCSTMDCLERLPDKSKDLVIIAANDDSSRSPNYTGYDQPLYKRIQQLYRIVSEGGIVFIESGQADLSLVRKYMDEIFGRRCFVREFTVPTGYYFRTDEYGRTPAYETLIGYSREPDFILRPIKRTKSEVEKTFNFEDQRGRFRLESLSTDLDRPNLKFDWQGIKLPKGKSWRHLRHRMDEMLANDEIDLSKAIPFRKTYMTEEDNYRHAPNLWNDIAWSEGLTSKWNHGAYSKRLLEITASENLRVLDIWSWGQRIIDECIDMKYSYLGLVGMQKRFERRLDPCASELTGEPYRGLIREVSREEVKAIPFQPIIYKRLEITREDAILNIIAGGETQHVEFKQEAVYNHHKGKEDKDLIFTILKVIVSFANTERGGTLLIGVADDGKLFDLQANEYKAANSQKQDKDGYCLYLNDRIATLTNKLVLSLCKIEILTIDEADICVIEVKSSERPVFFRGEYYRRQGTQDQKFTTKEFYDKIMLDELEYGANRLAIV